MSLTGETGSSKFRKLNITTALLASTAIAAISMPAHAQEAEASVTDDDVIVVEGLRATIQDSIEIKRSSTSIVDGLSADDIGELPALSIGEALETVASVASQREGSGATSVSIRGLGTFLGSTVINGREATNGSGDRSVNFTQFPSELFNKIEIYKTQEASLIEGGVAGQIALSTLKPLDYNERRVQLQAKFNVNPDNLAIANPERTIGYRLTGSYVDQFDTSIGEIGISFGAQTNVTPNPEQEARSTSTFQTCTLASLDSSSCNGGSPNISAEDISAMTGDRIGLDEEFVITSSSRSFRQNITDDKRNSVFGALQWKPSERVEINLDGQYSHRDFKEYRSDIVFDANDIEAIDTDVADLIFPLTTAADGSLRTATTTGNVEVNSQFSERIEEYIGFGGNISVDLSDRLNLSIDGSYSKTSRRENQIQARVRTESSQDVGIEVLQNGSQAHQFTVVNLDVTDPATFDGDDANDLRVREDLNQYRNQSIWAIRGDLEYDVSGGFIDSVQAGVRYSSLSYDQLPRVRFETDGSPNPLATEFNGEAVDTSTFGVIAATACANGSFPEDNFLDDEVSGNLITNVDSDGNVLEAGTGNTFLTFDGLCLAEAFLGRDASVPSPSDASGAELVQSVDIQEDTLALYGQVNFDSQLGSTPVRGNFGLRYINTELTSNSFRSNLTLETDMDGIITGVTADLDDVVALTDKFSYSEFLPSFNLVAELQDDLLFRGAIFRALSRPDPSDLGSGRTFNILSLDDTDATTTVADFIGGINSNGNPRLEPFLSWNFDAALEWYPNQDTILAAGLYYKVFNGGFENIAQTETFIVDGESFDAIVPVQSTSDETNTIFGLEVTAAHAFTYLPEPFDGLGFKVSYNYADSNFDFEDGQFGDATLVAGDGTITNLSAIIPSANLPGLSKHTFSGQLYWSIGRMSMSAIAKHRSEYFQQFISTPQNLRFIKGATVYEARISYKLTDNIKLSLEGVNLFNEPREHYNPTLDNFAEINVYGPRYFAGVTAKF